MRVPLVPSGPLHEDGKSDFDKLHSRAHDRQVFLYAFDLLELTREDNRNHPLEKRKAKLEKILEWMGLGGADSDANNNPNIPSNNSATVNDISMIILEQSDKTLATGKVRSDRKDSLAVTFRNNILVKIDKSLTAFWNKFK